MVCGEYTLSCISRDALLNWHAAGALARHEGISREAAARLLADTVGVTDVQIRHLPLSAEENARLRRVALDTIWRCRSAFVTGAAVCGTNMLFGPDKNLLATLGLPTVEFGIMKERKTQTNEVPVVSWMLLGSQCVFLGVIYLLVLRTIYQTLRLRSCPAVVAVCLGFAMYVLILSSGLIGDPRYRWPTVPLLTVAAAASLRRTKPQSASDGPESLARQP